MSGHMSCHLLETSGKQLYLLFIALTLPFIICEKMGIITYFCLNSTVSLSMFPMYEVSRVMFSLKCIALTRETTEEPFSMWSQSSAMTSISSSRPTFSVKGMYVIICGISHDTPHINPQIVIWNFL